MNQPPSITEFYSKLLQARKEIDRNLPRLKYALDPRLNKLSRSTITPDKFVVNTGPYRLDSQATVNNSVIEAETLIVEQCESLNNPHPGDTHVSRHDKGSQALHSFLKKSWNDIQALKAREWKRRHNLGLREPTPSQGFIRISTSKHPSQLVYYSQFFKLIRRNFWRCSFKSTVSVSPSSPRTITKLQFRILTRQRNPQSIIWD